MSSKPSLSFYTNIPTPYQQSFFKELSKLFHLTVVFYSISENNRSWQFTMQEDYEVVVLKNNFIANTVQRKVVDFHFSWNIFKTVWKDNSQYIIVGGSYWIPNGAAALLIQRLKGKKIAYFSEPLFVTTNKLKYSVKWSMLRILNSCCDALFCIGKKAADSFVKYGVTVPTYIIPYNINEQQFVHLDKIKMETFKQKYNPDDKLVILSSGALVQRKGMDVLIQAIKQIPLDNITLIIIGDGPERDALERLAAGDQRIVFAGFQAANDIPYFFGLADMFAIASRYDGWAVVINEAIAAGVPIISSNAVGASIELIQHKQNGWLCANESIEDFKEAIYTLATQPHQRLQLQEEAKKLIPLISSSYNAQYVYQLFTETI